MDRSLKGWIAVAALVLSAAAPPASAGTIEVTITSAGEHSYELTVGPVRRQGRLSAEAGASTVRDAVEIGSAPEVTAGLVFTDDGGRSCSCPSVTVALDSARPSCDPAFERPPEPRPDSCSCRSTCRARAGGPREGEPEDEDEAETAVARKTRQLLSNPFTRTLWSGPARRAYTRRARKTQ